MSIENPLESNPEDVESQKKERIKQVSHLFEIGMDSDDCIGYHGTSLECVQFLIENGYIPGGINEITKTDFKAKSLHFYPRKSQFPDHPLVDEFIKESELVKEASGYAELIAGSHYFLKRLGLDINNYELEFNARSLVMDSPNDPNDPDAEYRFFLGLGIDKKTLNDTIKAASKRKGVVLALSKNILTSYVPMPGDKKEGDLKLSIPEGLNLNFLSGLEPIGEEEYDFFEKLQKENQ